MVVQIDMEKVYNHVHWNFVEDILFKMGFGRTWCNWIKVCMSSATFSIMINGYPEGFFKSSRGIKQGDPLSPFIFNVVMRALCKLVLKAEGLNLIQGCQIGPSSPMISLIQYVDNTLFFVQVVEDHIRTLRGLLIFEAISGLKVNLHKSKLIGVGSASNIDTLASLLECQTNHFPCSCLGLPLGAKYSSSMLWKPVVERVKLSSWKGKYLSKGKKTILIKSVLSSIPLYFLS